MDIGLYGAVGLQLALVVVGGLYGGSELDLWYHTTPWFTIIGLTVGSVVGFINLIRMTAWKNNKWNNNNSSRP